jgi:hypothetical protein
MILPRRLRILRSLSRYQPHDGISVLGGTIIGALLEKRKEDR